MKTKYRARRSQLEARVLFSRLRKHLFRIKSFCAIVLMLLLMVSVMPVRAIPKTDAVYKAVAMQGSSTLTFLAEADARVEEANRNTNYGKSTYLHVNGINNPDVESFFRFTVSGLTGSIASARLRVFVTTNGSANSPAVYGANNSWTETGITWMDRPARTTNALDNKGAAGTSTWLEYNIDPFVTGNGTYTLVLVADSSDGITLSSREGNRSPELVITTDSPANTATFTQTAIQSTSTTTPVPVTQTATQPSDTNTPTMTQSPAATQAFTPTPTRTATTSSGSTLTFTTTADARVSQLNPTMNYGTATTLQADGNAGELQMSYIRFAISGITGSIQSVRLRIFCTTNGTTNGPAVQLANNNWMETGTGGINWNNRPALIGSASDNKAAFGSNSWVEYDVTALVTGNGTYTLALVADSTDGVVFSSREGATPPQLVVTLGTGGGEPTLTPTIAPTNAQTATVTPSLTSTATPISSESVVLVGAGDIAHCNRTQDEQTALLLDNIPGTIFTTGDNAYIDGTYTEYLNCYEPSWGRHKSRTKPSPGNHDYLTSGAAGYFQYFNNIPSYYAYDLGAWRIYSLNSEISASATSAQVTWLQNDLGANPRQCVLAYWHKPRWSSGSNHGDNTNMQTLWQVLYNAGAELVINGHEHHYERFAEMNASGAAASSGLREIVVGTGGAGLYPFGTPKAASQIRNNNTYGVLKVTLHPTGYEWQFIPIAGLSFTDSGSDTCH